MACASQAFPGTARKRRYETTKRSPNDGILTFSDENSSNRSTTGQTSVVWMRGNKRSWGRKTRITHAMKNEFGVLCSFAHVTLTLILRTQRALPPPSSGTSSLPPRREASRHIYPIARAPTVPLLCRRRRRRHTVSSGRVSTAQASAAAFAASLVLWLCNAEEGREQGVATCKAAHLGYLRYAAPC